MSDRTGFLLHGENDAERAADTNATWEVEEDNGIETLRPHVKGYYAAEPGERIDGAKVDWGWSDDSHTADARGAKGTIAVERGICNENPGLAMR